MIARPMIVAFVLGLLSTFLCFLAAAAGHGTYVPLFLFLGPLAVIPGFYGPAFALGPFLYPAYIAILRRCKRPETTWAALGAIGLLHYTTALVDMAIAKEKLSYMLDVIRASPLACVLAAMTFVIVNGFFVWFVVSHLRTGRMRSGRVGVSPRGPL